MSITKEAIQHIEKTQLLSDVNKALEKAKLSVPMAAMPEGVQLKSIEPYMPNRSSYRFNFSTKSIPDFAEYCQEFDKEGAKCFVNSDRMYAETIFDLGTEEKPLHQLHNAKLKLDKTAAFKALLQVNGDHISQKQASDFIEDWASEVKIYTTEGDLINANLAAQRFREITLDEVKQRGSSVGDFYESMSEIEKIEARNANQIPASIKFTCNPYHGLGVREFDIRVSIITGGSKPVICLRIIKLEAQEEDMAEEFKEILSDKFFESELKVLIGES